MIVFASRTGNVRSIVEKLGLPSVEIHNSLIMNKPFVLFTYTDGLGQVPLVVNDFMANNHKLCKGVIVSGNINFGVNYCKAGDIISQQYNIPLLEKFDLRGQQTQIENVIKKYKEIME